jgi:hypothetical protein
MHQRLRWRHLVPGVIALTAVCAVALFILVFLRLGALHGKTTHLYATTDEARDVLRGTDVWLNGQKIGAVDGITFRPPTADTGRRLLISMQILDEYRSQIRHNSTMQVRSGGSLLGSPVVYISGGTAASPPVSRGDTIPTLPQSDVEGFTSQMALASRDFPAIINNVKTLNAAMHSAEGTLGALDIDRGGPELGVVEQKASRLMSRIGAGTGTIGLALHERASLLSRAASAAAGADSLRQLVTSDQSSLGRFRRDSTLLRNVQDVRNELTILQARLASPDGNLGRMRADSALLESVARARKEMTVLFTDLRRHPLRYVHF